MANPSPSPHHSSQTPEESLCEQLAQVPDPRRAASVDYPLREILFIALCAMLSSADAFTEFEEFGQTRQSWLRKHLELKNGVPSHDTFRTVFGLIDPKAFNHFFIQWTQGLCKHDGGELIAIDGKSLRGSSKDQAVHLVNAWAAENNLILGQMATDKKSNEITAIPKLLKQLAIKGSIITIDAMGTRKEIAAVIDDAGASYVLSLKDNHPTLHEDVATFMDDPVEAAKMDFHQETDGGHGRVEGRRSWITDKTSWLDKDWQWAGLCALGKVERTRELTGKPPSVECAYYLCSIEADAQLLARCVRGHWGVENKVHWVLDVTFSEDACQVHEHNVATNLSMLRKMSLNLLRNDPSKGTLKGKRKRAGWDIGFLESILGLTHA